MAAQPGAESHEIVHVLRSRAGFRGPPYWEEGLATYYGTSRPYSGFSDWGKEIFAKGMAEGLATGELFGQVKGRAASIIALLEHRGLSVGTALQARVMACTDLALLDRWFRRAATGCSLEETFAG